MLPPRLLCQRTKAQRLAPMRINWYKTSLLWEKGSPAPFTRATSSTTSVRQAEEILIGTNDFFSKFFEFFKMIARAALPSRGNKESHRDGHQF